MALGLKAIIGAVTQVITEILRIQLALNLNSADKKLARPQQTKYKDS